jgi:mono/diheme cytochrome c family protein
MRAKTLGVFLVVGFALFTAVYWVTDELRREAQFEEEQAALVEYGLEIFGPDTVTVDVVVTAEGYEPDEVEFPVNGTVNFVNKTEADIVLAGEGADTFSTPVRAGREASTKITGEGTTTVSTEGVAGSLGVVTGPEAFNPAAANCARCHGADGTGGQVGDTDRQAPNLHSRSLAEKWKATGGKVAGGGQPPVLDNYVNLVIRHGGVVVSGDIRSPMPAWEGTLTLEQINALTALIGTWADEALQQPAEDIADTPEAGREVYASAGCGGCHGADLAGTDIAPGLLNIGNEPVTELPTPISQLDQLVADYEDDPRNMLELWIRDSAGNYNDGTATGMPPHPESTLSESALRALITFLLEQKQ